jgi:hypothetical protein
MRLWYARRGIPWVPLLACLFVAVLAAVTAYRWPATTFVMLPGALASCAAAAAFVLDEPSASAVWVTPRGGRWARLTRFAVVVLPATLWCAVVATLAEPGVVDRPRWAAAGLGAQAVALVLAALSSRRGIAMPGNGVAPAVAGMSLMPFVIGPLLGWTPLAG